MAAQTVRITPRSHQVLRELSRSSGRTMQAILDEALEAFRRRAFLSEANRAFARLRRNRKEWRREAAERRAWDRTVADGL